LTCWSTSPKTGSLFDLLRMTRELEDLLGHSVDVVSAGGLKDRDRNILDESVGL
jgi:predicted nucleotidyltransferase